MSLKCLLNCTPRVTAEEFGGSSRTVAESESGRSRVNPDEEPETVIPEPIVESGPVELAAAEEEEEEEEAAQGQRHPWAMSILLKYCHFR